MAYTGAGWYGFTGFVQKGNYFIGSGLTHVEQTGWYSSDSAAIAYANKTWGGQITYKFLGSESSAVSEGEDLLKKSGRGEVLVSGPYPTQAEAENFVMTEKTGAGATTTGTGSTDVQGPDISTMLQWLQSGAFWERIGEAIAGIILLNVALKGMIPQYNQVVQQVKSTAKKAGKAAFTAAK